MDATYATSVIDYEEETTSPDQEKSCGTPSMVEWEHHITMYPLLQLQNHYCSYVFQ